jgi:hypothetical protein
MTWSCHHGCLPLSLVNLVMTDVKTSPCISTICKICSLRGKYEPIHATKPPLFSLQVSISAFSLATPQAVCSVMLVLSRSVEHLDSVLI